MLVCNHMYLKYKILHLRLSSFHDVGYYESHWLAKNANIRQVCFI